MKPITVLIAEDQVIVREGLKTLLSMQDGFTVVGEASDGFEVIDQLKLLAPDVVLMDLSMPHMDGTSAIIQAKKIRPDVHIVALTAHDSERHVYDALKAGAGGYCLKTADFSELVRAIQEVCSGGVFLSAGVCRTVVEEWLSGKSAEEANPIDRLTWQERRVLRQIASGKSNQAAGEALYISPRTIEKHKTNIKKKLGLKTGVQLASFCLENGLND